MTHKVLNDSTAAGRPALGASFTLMSDATLWLARAPGQDREVRTAEVLRSRISVRPPPFPQDCAMMCVQDDGGELHVSNTARKGTGKLVRRLHPPSFHCRGTP
jgi:hypothetical protein